ncbi:hypothetical protein EBI_26522, partial [Enterocytozoon bieneusi H348]
FVVLYYLPRSMVILIILVQLIYMDHNYIISYYSIWSIREKKNHNDNNKDH